MNARVLIALFLLTAFNAAFGADAPSGTAKKVTAATAGRTAVHVNAMNVIIGKIEALDQSTKTIIVAGHKNRDTVAYTDSTRIKTADKSGAVSSLKPGTRVIIFCDTKSGQKVALKIAERMQVGTSTPTSDTTKGNTTKGKK